MTRSRSTRAARAGGGAAGTKARGTAARRRAAQGPPPRSTAAAPQNAPAPARATRIAGIDALRGAAIIAMIAYHFCFDLRYFGVTRSDFEHDLRWLTARTLILSSFLLISGISAVLAHRQAVPLARWLRRIAQIAAAAVLVSIGSWLMFPQSFIWFGVLHAIAVSLVLARPLLSRPAMAALAGALIVAAGLSFADPAFDNRVLGFAGFMTHKPVTEDYVPLFPWAGVLFLGVALGHVLARTRFTALAPLARSPAALRWLGRHSLPVYLAHQPIMLGLLWLATR